MRRADANQAEMIAGTDATFRPDPELLQFFPTIELSGRHALVAAVSGGSDSLALLFLTKTWLEAAAPGVRLVAVTVDHGLRPQSAAEARDVAALCARHGIAHRIMRWDGAKPANGISAAARAARYRLLAEAARAAETDIILTGHTLDDQVETVAMRSRRGEGRGLAGMAAATLFEGGTWIVRPLLAARREALRDFLRQNGIGWADDPTNSNPAYERARVRADLAAGDLPSEPPSEIAIAQRHRGDIDGRAAALLLEMATQPVPGLIRLRPDFPATTDVDAAVHLLRILLAACGGTPHLPDETRSRELFRRLKDGRLRATLSRCVVDARRDGIYFRREARGLPEATPAIDGLIWDGRYRLRCPNPLAGLTVAPLGAEHARKAAPALAGVPQSLVLAAFAAAPALWSKDQCLGPLAGEGEGTAGLAALPVIAPWARFLPSFDLAAARALAELLGCEARPRLPFVGHKEG